MAFHSLSFSAFGADENPTELRKLCGASLSVVKPGIPITVLISGGRAQRLDRVTGQQLRDFNIFGREDDLDYLIGTTKGENLLLAEAIAPLIKALHWEYVKQDTNSNFNMVLSAVVPAEDPDLGLNKFQIYEYANNKGILFGQVSLQFSSLAELDSAIGSLNKELNGKTDYLYVIVDATKKTLLITEIDLHSLRDQNDFIQFVFDKTSGVRLFMHFLKKYGIKKQPEQTRPSIKTGGDYSS